MTPEQLLLAALTVVSGVLSTFGKIIWDETKECKVERRHLREELEEVREKVGLNSGRLQAVDRCPIPSCPFRPTINKPNP